MLALKKENKMDKCQYECLMSSECTYSGNEEESYNEMWPTCTQIYFMGMQCLYSNEMENVNRQNGNAK